MTNNNPPPMPERWMPIEGYEGYYEVSDLGRVRSLDREIKHKRLGRQKCKGRIISQTLDTRGYYKILLCVSGDERVVTVHKLVAEAFIGKSNGLQVNHINGVRTDNRLENIEYVTARENKTHGRKTRAKYTGCTKTKSGKWFSCIQINKKRFCLGTYENPEDAAAAYRNALIEHGLENKYAR